MENHPSQFKSRIYYKRIEAGISQRKLSAQTGLNREALILWEKTGKEPKLRPWQTLKLLKILNCTLEEITDDNKEDGLMAA